MSPETPKLEPRSQDCEVPQVRRQSVARVQLAALPSGQTAESLGCRFGGFPPYFGVLIIRIPVLY